MFVIHFFLQWVKQEFTLFIYFFLQKIRRFRRYQENCPLWKYPPVKITPQNFSPEKIAPWANYPQSNPLPTNKSYQWKKKQNCKIFCLEESCAIQHPYQNNQGPLWYTDDLTENTGLRYFLYKMKKSKNWTKAKIAKWHLLASCTSQGELKLGSQIIKFGK